MPTELVNIYEDNKNLIYSLANNFNYQNRDDLFQVGVIGLINAYNNFDDKYGVKFSTYAYSYILGEMKKLVREDKGVKISREISKLNLKIEKVSLLLAQKMMREPTITEIAHYLEIPEWTVSEALKANNNIQSLDAPINTEEKEMLLAETIADIPSYDLNDLINLKEELQKLLPIQKKLIELRYFADKSQSETATILGISQVQVSRIEQKTIAMLKNRIDF